MARIRSVGCGLLLLALVGCQWDEVSNPFSSFMSPASRNNVAIKPEEMPAASIAAATYVHEISAKVLAANPDLGFPRPTVWTVGKPELFIAHRGSEVIVLSEGLVKRCKNEAELAALISAELGQMVAEAEAQKEIKNHENEQVHAPRVTGSIGDSRGDPDQTAVASQAYWERDNPRQRRNRQPARDPEDLARNFLRRAGYEAEDLNRVRGLLRQAESNPTGNSFLTSTKPVGTLPPVPNQNTPNNAANNNQSAPRNQVQPAAGLGQPNADKP